MDKNKYYEFYEECLKNGFKDFDNDYEHQKIVLLAKKYNLENASHFSIDDFRDAKNKHDNYILNQEEEKNKKEEEDRKFF